MADKPSRALVLYGDGLSRYLDESHTHLNSLASKAACGFLSLPNGPPSEKEDERIVREFACLLDSTEAYQNTKNFKTTIPDRFMGIRAAIISDNPSLNSFCGKLGFAVLPFGNLYGNLHSVSGSSVDSATSELLKLLGFQEGKTLGTNQFDLVFVHIGAGEKINSGGSEGIANAVEYVNALVGSILQVAQPGSEIGSRLLLSVVMSYGSVTEVDSTNDSILMPTSDMHPDLLKLFPHQSYNMRGETLRNDVRDFCPMLVAQWQDAVTRMDLVEKYSFKDFKEHGVNLTIPADRFLHEVAFKLWKAPKYGA